MEGWGVVHENTHFYGPWDESGVHIDALELTTILIALQILPILSEGANLKVFCDNTVANAYVKHMGGNKPRLHQIARKIWDLLEEHNAFLTAVYVASKDNVADQYTRGFSKETKRFLDLEARLDPLVFKKNIFSMGPFRPTIDWFASNVNKQLPRFCAWQEGTEGAEFLDAFSHDWSIDYGYMFPPFGLLPKVLRKICEERAKVILIHPDWPGALWAPTIKSKLQNFYSKDV